MCRVPGSASLSFDAFLVQLGSIERYAGDVCHWPLGGLGRARPGPDRPPAPCQSGLSSSRAWQARRQRRQPQRSRPVPLAPSRRPARPFCRGDLLRSGNPCECCGNRHSRDRSALAERLAAVQCERGEISNSSVSRRLLRVSSERPSGRSSGKSYDELPPPHRSPRRRGRKQVLTEFQ